jgi:hypothetical protein
MLARVNWLAIVAVVVLNFVAGAAWYGALADPWLSAIGKGMADFDGQSPMIYVLPILASILNALILATVMQLADEVTPTGGVRWALLLWVGLVFPYALVHNAFSAFPLTLTLIDSGLALVTMVADGLVLGLMRPRAVAAGASA